MAWNGCRLRHLDQWRRCSTPCHPRHSIPMSRGRNSGTLRWTWPAFFLSPCAQNGQYCMGQHGQGDVPAPTLPVANLVVIQPALALGGLEGLLDLPALSSHTGQGFKRGFAGGRVDRIVGVFGLLIDTAPHQQRPRQLPFPACQTLLHHTCRRFTSHSKLGLSFIYNCSA